MEALRIQNNKQFKKATKGISEIAFVFFLAVIWLEDIVFSYVQAFLLRLPGLNILADGFTSILLFFLALLSVPYISNKVKINDVIFYAVCVFVYLLHLIFYQDNIDYLLPKAFEIFIKILPLYFVGLTFEPKKHTTMLYKLSIITIWLRLVYAIVFEESMDSTASLYEGDMWSSYCLLPHICLVCYMVLSKRGILNIITLIVGLILSFSFGTRGPLLCILCLAIVYFLIIGDKKISMHVVIAMIFVGIIVVLSFNWLMSQLYDIATRLGLSIRIFDKLSHGEFFVSDSRNDLKYTLSKHLWDKIFGYGLAGDRVILGVYAHNIIYELWISFGVLLGTIAFLLIVAFILKTFKEIKKTRCNAILLLVLFCSCFIKLFLSGSYLNEKFLFLFFGLCVSVLRQKEDGVKE